MGGYCLLIMPCRACGKMISCNPNYVPSIVVDDRREPVCETCFDLWNKIHRIDKGLEPVALHPDAYSPLAEEELA